jgi:alginate O-acetyltransferase complex protein AlgJ
MKKFLLMLLVFFVPVLVLMVVEVMIPPNMFSFRPWEGLKYSTTVTTYCQFYPNQSIEMDAVGDLAHHTDKAVHRTERWVTDKLGYRNDAFIEQADVLIIGDSFIAGTGLTQDDLLSNKLQSKMGKGFKIYNMAPSSFAKFDYFLRLGIIKKPKMIIFVMVERHLPDPLYQIPTTDFKSKLVKYPIYGSYTAIMDKAFRFSSLKWLNARIHHYYGNGLRAVNDSTMFFLEGYRQKHAKSDLARTVRTIKSYKKYCDNLGIKFLYLPMPDKETVYYEQVPIAKQADYLVREDSMLNTSGVATIKTLGLYNNFRKTHSEVLYQPDDSHWNPIATELVSEELYKFLNGKIK